MHRSFHAIPPLTLKSGEIVNAVYGFTSFLMKSLTAFKPDYIALTFDRKAPTFRHEAFADYKATRVKAPDELYAQFPLVKEMAAAFDIPIFELDGYEADDLIGTLGKQAAKEHLRSIIITGDLDTLQLVDDDISVYTMSRGLSDSVLYDEKAVQERYGLRPDQMIDYKGLRGDVSDNIPGVKGIGEKTASDLLQKFGTLEKVIAAAKALDPAIKPRIANLIREQEDTAKLSKELATIDCDAPIEITWEKIAFSPLDKEQIASVFKRFEFNSLLNRLDELASRLATAMVSTSSSPTSPVPKPKAAAKYSVIANRSAFDKFTKRLAKEKSFAFDLETSQDGQLAAASFAWQDNEAYSLDLQAKEAGGWLESLKGIWEDEKIGKAGQNLKASVKLLSTLGIKLRGQLFDTLIASYLLHPEERQHTLEKLSLRELGYQKTSKADLEAGQKQMDFGQTDQKAFFAYTAENADVIWRAKEHLARQMSERGLEKLFETIEMPLIPVLAAMEEKGILIDEKRLSVLEKKLAKTKRILEKEIYEMAGEEFNIASPKQLQTILFEKLEISSDGLARTKTGISTAEDELQKMLELHPIIALIQKHRETSKLLSTYILPLPKLADKEGAIHSNFQQAVAATGRLSSTDPNLQNIPTRTEEGKLIRSAFIARPGKVLLGFDYSQIELRLAAHISGDEKMIAAFVSGQDIHRITAAEINGITEEEVTAAMRREAKATNFGILYGQGPHGLAQAAGIPYAKAKDFIAAYFESYPDIRKMVDGFIKDAKEKGYAETMFGRRRYIPEINSPSGIIRRSGERMAINTPIQGSAADLIKKAMVEIYQAILSEDSRISLLLQIHDELIFEVDKGREKEYIAPISDIMENTVSGLKVPIKVEWAAADDWGGLK